MVCTLKLGAGKPHQNPVDTEEEIFVFSGEYLKDDQITYFITHN